MTLIDHRVLINASPEVIWELLGDLTARPKWHTNCAQVIILTTQRSGVGVRCRVTPQTGRDVVEEVLSWYSTLGYEYTIIDGPYASNRGRIRLRPISEGTVVQWTFEYQPRGIGGGLRNRLGQERQLNSEISNSLNRLKKLVESTGIRMDDLTRERVAMRPAPTVEERAVLAEDFIRAHPSLSAASQETVAARTPAPEGVLDATDEVDLSQATVVHPPPPLLPDSEPPLTEEDTRPRAALAVDATALTRPANAPPDSEHMAPDMLAIVLDEAYEEPPTEPAKPVEMEPAPEIPIGEQETIDYVPALSPEEPLPESAAPTPDESPVDVPTEDVSDQLIQPPLAQPIETLFEKLTSDLESVEQPQPAEAPPAPEQPPTPLPEPAMPSARAPLAEPEPLPSVFQQEFKPMGPSIWDVFGITPPSQAEAEAQSVSPTAETATEREAKVIGVGAAPPADIGVSAPPVSPSQSRRLFAPRARKNGTHPGLRKQGRGHLRRRKVRR